MSECTEATLSLTTSAGPTIWKVRVLQRQIAQAFDLPLSIFGLDRPALLNAGYQRRQKNRVKRRRR